VRGKEKDSEKEDFLVTKSKYKAGKREGGKFNYRNDKISAGK
jgi:hypothetical protein